jgi:hypothetical protein
MPVDVDFTKLRQFAMTIDEAIAEGLQEAGEMIKDLGSELAPKETGDLANSGKSELIDSHTVEVSFGNDLPDARAVAQEFGTYNSKAQSYLGPAARNIDVALEVAKALGKRL